MNRLLRSMTAIAAAAVCAGISEIAERIISEKSGDISLSSSEGTGGEILLGDVLPDGVIDSSDASLILAEYSAVSIGKKSTLTEEQAKAADVDRDGKIDSTDASFVLSYYSTVSTGREITIEELIAEITGG